MVSKLSLFFALLLVSVLPAAASDEVHFGQDIQISEENSTQDVVCFLCSVEAKGNVQGNIVVFGGNLKLDGRAQQDVVVFGGNVTTGEGTTISQDLVIFGGRLRSGPNTVISGDRVIFPPINLLPIFLVLVAIVWGAFLFIRWIIDRVRPVYIPQR